MQGDLEMPCLLISLFRVHILSNLSTKNLMFVSAMKRLRRNSFWGDNTREVGSSCGKANCTHFAVSRDPAVSGMID